MSSFPTYNFQNPLILLQDITVPKFNFICWLMTNALRNHFHQRPSPVIIHNQISIDIKCIILISDMPLLNKLGNLSFRCNALFSYS